MTRHLYNNTILNCTACAVSVAWQHRGNFVAWGPTRKKATVSSRLLNRAPGEIPGQVLGYRVKESGIGRTRNPEMSISPQNTTLPAR